MPNPNPAAGEPPRSDPTLGQRLQQLRGERGLSVRELERELGSDGPSKSSIDRFEKGTAQPSLKHLAAYERRFGLEPGTLQPVVDAVMPLDSPARRRTGVRGFHRPRLWGFFA